jgi:hypothetical protein
VRTKIVAAVGLLPFAVPGAAAAGNVTPVQYAYGGGSNATAVIATQPPASPSGESTGAGASGSSPGGVGASTGGAGAGPGASGSSPVAAGPKGHRPGETTAQPLVGLSGAPAAPAASGFDALHHAIPAGALWAIALAAACALGAWLVRRGST